MAFHSAFHRSIHVIRMNMSTATSPIRLTLNNGKTFIHNECSMIETEFGEVFARESIGFYAKCYNGYSQVIKIEIVHKDDIVKKMNLDYPEYDELLAMSTNL